MKKETQIFKMGTNWMGRFITKKKTNEGWNVITINKNTQHVIKPDGSLFAEFNTVTGIVTSTANIMDVQW